MIECKPLVGRFPRIEVPSSHHSGEDLLPYVEHGILLADFCNEKVHLIDEAGYTFHIVHPEPR